MAKALAADAKYISDKIAQAQPLQLQSITKDDATIQLHFKETKPIQVRPCRQWRAFCTSASACYTSSVPQEAFCERHILRPGYADRLVEQSVYSITPSPKGSMAG
jgi:hypothetical protein